MGLGESVSPEPLRVAGIEKLDIGLLPYGEISTCVHRGYIVGAKGEEYEKLLSRFEVVLSWL